MVFLISDFINSGYEKGLKMVSNKHDLVAVKIIDPRETVFPEIGFIELEDAETGELILVDTYDKKFNKKFQQLVKDENEKLIRFFRANRIDYLEFRTDVPYIKDLIRFFRLKEKRQR